LIIRGARQVGKSTLVKLFCENESLDIIELNFEIEKLVSINKEEIELQEIIDEIQESPKLLKYLRYFYEKAPQLKVIAAGSLLEIALKTEDFSFPVGRVEFYHLGPMTFQEFLWATGDELLEDKISKLELSDAVHTAALKALRAYFYVGGMPEVIKKYVETNSIVDVRELQSQLLQSYQADFPKYNKRINSSRIERVFASLAYTVGEKIIYSKVDNDSTSRDTKRVVELLIDARVVLPCYHTSGNSSPLRGEIDERIFKTYYLDIGLLGAMLNIDYNTIDMEFSNNFNFKGKLAEQFVAQHLAYVNGPTNTPSIFYYLRDKSAQRAEVDFLIEMNTAVLPIEVKASKSGHLKSLQLFCKDKQTKTAIKTSLNAYEKIEKFGDGRTTLYSLPLYAMYYIKNLKI